MSKMMFTSYSQDEFKNEIREVLEEVLAKKKEEINSNLDDEFWGDDWYGKDCSIEVFDKNHTSKKTTTYKSRTPREKYLTRGEVAKFLKISLPTLHRYTRDSILKSYRIGGKVRYKLVEVEEALQERNFGLPKKGGHHV